VKRIAPEPKDSSPLTSDQLVRLAHFLSGRVHLECPNCGLFQRFTVGGGELRLGSSPDLSVLNPAHTSKPRLLFYCSRCRRVMGYVQGDTWSSEMPDGTTPTRWDRLELDENPEEKE